VKAYHFLRKDMTSAFGKEPPWKVGETRTFEGLCSLGYSGYHSSRTWLDALVHAKGPIACKVEVSKPLGRDLCQQVSRTRTLLDCRDATNTLRRFAYECVERCLTSSGSKASTLWKGVETLQLWLQGKVDETEFDRVGRIVYNEINIASYYPHLDPAYIIATAFGQGAVGIENATAIAAHVIDLHISRATVADLQDGWSMRNSLRTRETAWARKRLGQLMSGLFKTKLQEEI